MRPRIIFWIILTVAVFFRFYQLGRIPAGVSNDETVHIYSANSIWKTGHDFAGKFLPLSFNFDFSYSPVPVYLIAPVVGLFGMNAVTGRLPFALAGIGTVGLVYVLAKFLFRRNSIALLAMMAMAVSPWHMFFSRTAYEAGLALFFFLFGMVLFLRGQKRGSGSDVLWSLLPFFLGFYSYHATKIFFLFFLPFLILLYWPFFVSHKRTLVLFTLGFFCILASFFVVVKTQGVSRQDVLLWKDTEAAVKTVNYERQRSLAAFWLRTVFSNKPLYFLKIMRQNYLEAFSPQFLFLYGETSGLAGLYGVQSRGVLYLVDLPLLLLGIYMLLRNKALRRSMLFTIGGLLIAPFPSMFASDRTYAVRSIMMQPFLMLLIAYGAYALAIWTKATYARYKKIVFGLFVGFYMVFVGSYFYEYLYRFPIVSAEAWFQSTKDIISYIDQNKTRYNQVIVANHGDPLFQYGFYTRMDPKALKNLLHAPYPRRIGNVSFEDECLETENPVEVLGQDTLYIVPERCHRQATPSATIKDKGEPLHVIWKIYAMN